MSLTSLVTFTLLSLVRPSVMWAPVPPERLAILADDIALAAQLHDGAPFAGPDRHALAAVALASIGVHESNFAARVVSCAYDGDPRPGQKPGVGRSIGAYQLMRGAAWDGHAREDLCPTGPLAAYVAFKAMINAGRCNTVIGIFRGYASGSCARPSAAATRQCKLFERAARAAGLETACRSLLRPQPTHPRSNVNES